MLKSKDKVLNKCIEGSTEKNALKQIEKPLKKLVLVGGNKGGPGKSFFARGFLDLIIESGRSHVAFDTDTQNPDIYRIYNSESNPVQLADIAKESGVFKLIDCIEDRELDYVLVDLPGGANRHILSAEGDYSFFDIVSDAGYQVIYVSVLERIKSSFFSLQTIIELTGDRAQHVAVQNLKNSTVQEFEEFEAQKTRDKLKAIGGEIINMPPLISKAALALDMQDLRFIDAANNKELRSYLRNAVGTWRSRFKAEVQKSNVLF